MVKLKINNQEIEVEEGTTLIHAAQSMGVEVPTLCYWEGVKPMNSCMLCVMRDSNTGVLHPSCSTMCQNGMDIETDSGDVCSARKDVLELVISEHVGDCEAPCTHTCPAHMNIPVMMRQIYEGDLDSAAYTVTNGLVFPGTLGYVCPAPCENPCRRKSYDETMKIKQLHREVSARALVENPELLDTPDDTGKHVAIIGAGLAGMAAAWVLRKSGHACTMYEREAKAGGKVRHLSEEELPKQVLDDEIEFIGKIGVNFNYNAEINGNGDLDALTTQYDAVIVACNDVTKPGGKVFEAKEHKLDVRAVGNGKVTATWVDKYLKSIKNDPPPKLFDSKYGKIGKEHLSKLLENKTAISVPKIEGELVDSRVEAGRCLHCDCRKRVSCGLRKWASDYGAEKKKFYASEEPDVRILGKGNVILEPGKCIRCGLCVAIAEKHDEDIGLAFVNRGFDMEIQVPFDHDFEEALKKSAPECVQACPTAAIAYRNGEDVFACHTSTDIELKRDVPTLTDL